MSGGWGGHLNDKYFSNMDDKKHLDFFMTLWE